MQESLFMKNHEVNKILDEAEEFPREDILYNASKKLSELIHDLKLADFNFDMPAVRFAVVLRAMGYCSTIHSEWFGIIEKATLHRDVEIRDAAVSALFDIGTLEALVLLKGALLTEPLPFIRETIQDAIEGIEREMRQ